MRVAVDAENTRLTLQEIPRKYADAYARVADYIYFRYKDFSSAKAYYEKALDIFPNHAMALRRIEQLHRER